MDFELTNNRGRTPPGMAVAAAVIVAAGVTGMAVAGLTWALDRPAGTPVDVAAYGPSPSPSATAPIETPGWAEALGLPAPVVVPSGGDPAAQSVLPGTHVLPGTEEAARRAAAARRPVVGPTASATRSKPTATNAAAAPAPIGSSSTTPTADPGASDPGALDPGASDPGTLDPGFAGAGSTDPGTTDPGTTDPGSEDPGLGDPGSDEPTATETTAPDTGRRNWEAPRRQWRDQPEPADPAPWNGPFGDFPRLFPWG
jgi:hypothetical protein